MVFTKGHQVSEETRKKISDSNKGKKGWNKGIPHSNETKIKMSNNHWSKKPNYIHPMLGKHHLEKTIKKLEEKIYSKRRGRTYEEMYGEKKAQKIKEIQSKNITKQHQLGLRKGLYKKIGKAQVGKHNSPNTEFKKGHKVPEYIRESIRKNRKTQIFPKRDSKQEVKIQTFLTQLHIEFFTHKYISEITHSYQCDILIPKQETEGIIIPQKTIIECDGCFFHACPICKMKEYHWTKERKATDEIRTKELTEKGYNVIRLWEHEIKVMELNDLKVKLE